MTVLIDITIKIQQREALNLMQQPKLDFFIVMSAKRNHPFFKAIISSKHHRDHRQSFKMKVACLPNTREGEIYLAYLFVIFVTKQSLISVLADERPAYIMKNTGNKSRLNVASRLKVIINVCNKRSHDAAATIKLNRYRSILHQALQSTAINMQDRGRAAQ